jgi:hypothetical protein
LLAAHIIVAALFVIFGTPMEPGEDQWNYFDRMQATFPVFVWGGFCQLFGNANFIFVYRPHNSRKNAGLKTNTAQHAFLYIAVAVLVGLRL